MGVGMKGAGLVSSGRTSAVKADRQIGSRRGRGVLRVVATVVLVALTTLTGCHVTTHRVGMGSNQISEKSMQQYYLFFGLVRLNEVDIQQVVGDYTSYDIEVGFCNRGGFWQTAGDLAVSAAFLPLTVTRQTVTVKY